MNTLVNLHNTIGGKLQSKSLSLDTSEKIVLGAVTTDSRRVKPGDVFWALSGPHYNGSDFAAEAFLRGAAGVVVSRAVEVPADRWAVTVGDTLDALRNWAKYRREDFSGTVIGVTGSTGKTTARQMIHGVLGSRLSGTASPHNYNNHIGLPLSMLNINSDDDYAVLELGASSGGEIASLAALCGPKIGVITNIGDAHLGQFGSRDGIAEAKTELLASLPPGGHAVLGDDPLLRKMAAGYDLSVTWVGRGATCDVAATGVQSTRGRLSFRIEGQPFEVPVWGRHHLTSALIAIALGRILGIELPAIAEALARFDGVPMRCEVGEVRGATIINDTYNASPAAMQAGLELLRDMDAPGRRVFVCGDMTELGDESPMLHRRLGDQVVTVCGADLLIASGKLAQEVVAGARAAGMPGSRAIACETIEESSAVLGQAVVPGDVVLVKGARAMAMERIIDAMKEYPRRRSA